jgi:alcohol dehydrogenase
MQVLNKPFSDWNHFNPVDIRVGVNSLDLIQEITLPGQILLVTSEGFVKRGLTERIKTLLNKSELIIYDKVKPNPELTDIDNAVIELKTQSFTGIIAIGGGSVLDFAKVLSILLFPGQSLSLYTIFRNSEPIEWHGKIPLTAIPTTSGTGAEVTQFATVWDSLSFKKYSLSHPLIFPNYALLDPALTLSLPPEITLHTALDCISHSLESIWNKNITPISNILAVESLNFTLQSLPVLMINPLDIHMRSKMQTAALLAGLSISQTKTALAHSISYPLTIRLSIPHGLACSFTLVGLIDVFLNEINDEKIHLIPLISQIRNLLISLNLSERILKIATYDDITQLSGEMNDPSRAGNFAIKTNEGFIPWLLDKSLRK